MKEFSICFSMTIYGVTALYFLSVYFGFMFILILVSTFCRALLKSPHAYHSFICHWVMKKHLWRGTIDTQIYGYINMTLVFCISLYFTGKMREIFFPRSETILVPDRCEIFLLSLVLIIILKSTWFCPGNLGQCG